jgi:hypothetical protein
VDLQTDPGETKNVAGDPQYQKILLEHRALLTQFAKELNDPLSGTLLADDVKPIPFTASEAEKKSTKKERKINHEKR